MSGSGALVAFASCFVRAIDDERCCDAAYCEPPLFAVADGVDHAHGSGQRVLDEVLRVLNRTVAGRDLRAALHAANWAAWYADPRTGRSSSTLTIARLERNRFVIGHVGDSRSYLVRGQTVWQLTDDHLSFAPDQLTLRAERLGSRPAEAPIDMLTLTALPGDKLLLCTDGLWREFEDRQLPDLLEGGADRALERLEQLAASAQEDASAVLIELRE